LLLVLMIVEILYTVQISFREHALVPEPFLVVGLIAGIRRVLVITAELSNVAQGDPDTFRHAMLELGLLTLMILALVGALGIASRSAARPFAPARARQAGRPGPPAGCSRCRSPPRPGPRSPGRAIPARPPASAPGSSRS